MFATAALPLVARFALIIAGLQDAVAAAIARQPTRAALIVLAHTRLQRLIARFASFVARAQAGTLRPSASPHRSAPRSGNAAKIPRGFGWLSRLGSWQAAGYRSQFQHLLADPEMECLLHAAPQAGRILRPLCHALGIRPLPDPLRLRPASPAAPSDPDAAATPRPPPRPAEPARPSPASAFARPPMPDP